MTPINLQDRIIDRIRNTTDDAAGQFYDESKVKLKRYLARPDLIPIKLCQKELDQVVKEQHEKELVPANSTNLQKELDDYSFLFPRADRDKALRIFDERSLVELQILRNTNQVKVRFGSPSMVQGNFTPTSGTTEANQTGQRPVISESDYRKLVQEGGTLQDAPQLHENAPQSVQIVSEAQDSPKPSDEPVEAKNTQKRNIAICFPTNRDVNAYVMFSIFGLWDRNQHIFLLEKDTLIHRARNILAHKFLETDAEWSFWLDSDIIAPFGNPKWFRHKTHARYSEKYMAKNAVEELTRGDKSLVSGVYASRVLGGNLVIQPSLHPRHDEDTRLVHQLRSEGPQDKIVPVNWVAFGCTAVHRKVFEDIKKTHPELAPKKEGDAWGFFDGEIGSGSEDVILCRRAKNAGHQSWLNCAVFAAHVGGHCFMP